MSTTFEIYMRVILLLLLFFCALRDWKVRMIPNEYLIRGISVRILLLLFETAAEGTEAIIGLLIKAGIGLLIVGCGILIRKLTKNGVGMGDVKLMAVMVLFLNVRVWFAAIWLSFLCGEVQLIRMCVRKNPEKKIPFAPCLLVGTLLAMMIWK